MRVPRFFLLAGLWLVATVLSAQLVENPAPPALPPSEAPAVEAPAGETPVRRGPAKARPGRIAQVPAPAPAAALAAETVPVRERERRIYVPFEDLEKVFEDGGRGVFLPYREFLELWNELTLKREEKEAKPPPVEAVLARAEYTGRVQEGGAVFDARLTVESFQSGWVSLPLSEQALPGIGEAETGRAVLQVKPDGAALLLPDKGVYEIRLKIYAPVTRRDGKSEVALHLPVAAVSRLSLMVPGTDLTFETQPAAAHTARERGEETEFSCFFGAGGSQEIAWAARTAAVEMEPLILASSKLRTSIGAGTVVTRAEITHRILRAPLERLRVGLPADQEVLAVTGPGVREWRLEDAAEGRRQLLVTLERPVRDEQALTLELEAPLPALPGEVRVPELEVIGAAHAGGEAVVTAEPQLDAAPRTLTAATRIQTAGGGAGEIGVFRLLRQPYALSFVVTEAQPQVEAVSQTRLELRRDAALLTAVLQFKVRRVGLFETRIGLPPGWPVTEVTGAVERWQVEGGEAAPELLVRLPKQMIDDIEMTVRARQSRGQAEGDFTLPVFSPRGVTRHEGVLGVVLPASLEANTKELGGLQQEDVNALRNGSGAAFWQEGPEAGLAFRYLDGAAPGVLALKSRSPQVSVEVLTLLDAREQSTRHQWTLAFEVSFAATDRFVLALPKSVADTARFVDPQIKEINRDHQPAQAVDLPDAENFALWEVVLRNERLGAFTLSGSHEQPAAIEAGGSATVNLITVHVPGAFQETGQVAVRKAESLEIRKAEVETLEEIDTRELRGELAEPGIFLAYKYRSLPVKLAVELVKNSYFAVPQAMVTHADLTTAVASDRAQTCEAVYWVKNNDLQFLEVSLPAGARLVSDVLVGREAQQPMRREGSEMLLVRLPSGSGQSAVPVRLVFEVPSPQPGVKLGLSGSFNVAVPEVSVVGVLETRHRLFLPEDWHYTGIAGPLTREARARGWGRVRRWIDPLIPALGPQPVTLIDARWSEPPQVEAEARSLFGFQVPQQGHLEVLRRLGPPAPLTVKYRSAKLTFAAEAAAFLITLLIGLRCSRCPPAQRLLFLAVAGFGALLATGLLGAANVPVANAVMLAVALLTGLWLLLAVWAVLRGIWTWLRSRPPKTKAVTASSERASTRAPTRPASSSSPLSTVAAGASSREPPSVPPRPPEPVRADDIEQPTVPPLPEAGDDTTKPGV